MILTQTIVEEMSRYFTYTKVHKCLAKCTLSVELKAANMQNIPYNNLRVEFNDI